MPDRDDEARTEAQAILDDLYGKYWDEAQKVPAPKETDLLKLERAYKEAVREYAKLQGRLMTKDILTSPEDLETFKKIRQQMADAVELKSMILAARDLIKLIIAIV